MNHKLYNRGRVSIGPVLFLLIIDSNIYLVVLFLGIIFSFNYRFKEAFQ